MIRRFFTVVVLFALLLSVSSCNSDEKEGTLQGTVTIGPIFPVERPGDNRPINPEVFKARTVIIYNAGRTQQIQTVTLTQIDASAKATYSVRLQAGSYTVDINHAGIDRSSEVPAKIEIKPGQTLKLDINIDTGIR